MPRRASRHADVVEAPLPTGVKILCCLALAFSGGWLVRTALMACVCRAFLRAQCSGGVDAPASTALAAVGIAAAIGLRLRREWGRRLFIAYWLVGYLVGTAKALLLQRGVWGSRPPVLAIAVTVVSTLVSGLIVFLIVEYLRSSKVRNAMGKRQARGQQ
jgi:hypothetical protein